MENNVGNVQTESKVDLNFVPLFEIVFVCFLVLWPFCSSLLHLYNKHVK